MSDIKYNLTRESATIVYQGKTHTVQKGSPNYLPLREALLNEVWDDVPKHLTVGKSLEEWARGEFKIDGDRITFRGDALPQDLNRRIVAMAREGSDPAPLFNFWERLQKNPSMRSVEQLWSFLQHTNIPLTPEGKFLAYKGVRPDYKDQHSGTVDNSPGACNRMPRNKISDDPRVECHFGFHVGALGYARGFSSKIVVCEVDPEHVVCVPYDHESQKMRVCEYKVIGNYGGPLSSTVVVPDTEDVEPFVETDEDDFEDEDEVAPAEVADPEPGPKNEDPADHKHPEDEKDPLEVAHEDADRERARTEEKEKAKQARVQARKGRVSEPDKRAEKKGFSKFNAMDVASLTKQSIEDLRKYASNGLEIVGASKIPGGKTELIKRILKVRSKINK